LVASRSQRRAQPALEALETRLAPATSPTPLLVTSLSADAAGGLPAVADNDFYANSLIQFDSAVFNNNKTPGTILITDFYDPIGPIGLYSGQLTITGPTDSQGNNLLTINGNNQLFFGYAPFWTFMQSGSITFNNINFQDFVTYQGLFAAAAPNESWTFNHCTFSHNTAISSPTNPGQIGNGYFGGGAIGTAYDSLGSLTLQNCVFTNNSADDGGAVFSNPEVITTITGCTLAGNTATDKGGAIYFAGAGLTIKGTTINGNNANYSGGGLFIDPATANISSSSITNNSAPVGADLYNLDSSTTLYNTTVGSLYNDTGSVTLISSTVGSNGGTITTPDSAATNLSADVSALIQAGALTADQGAGLTSKLQAAAQSLDAGNITPGANQLGAFINQVNAFVKSNKLTSTQAQPLLDGANQLLAVLNSVGARLLNDTGTSTTTDTQPVTSAGQLVTGPLGVYLDNADGTPVPAAEQARFDDAIATLDTTFGPFGVDLVDVGAGNAVVQVEIAGTSAAGSAADGVLGCAVAGNITLLTGWNWFTGADPTTIGAGQYDFETIVMHELGHAIGLGHSGDTGSVMYPYLAPGQARRVVTTQDMSVLESGGTAPHALLAAPCSDAQTAGGPDLHKAGPGSDEAERMATFSQIGRDLVFAALAGTNALTMSKPLANAAPIFRSLQDFPVVEGSQELATTGEGTGQVLFVSGWRVNDEQEPIQPMLITNADASPGEGAPRTDPAPVDTREQLPVGPASRAGRDPGAARLAAPTRERECDACFATDGAELTAETWTRGVGATLLEEFAPAAALVGVAFLLRNSSEDETARRAAHRLPKAWGGIRVTSLTPRTSRKLAKAQSGFLRALAA
jgi:hypothetical protein